jgi:hypothetical protein
MAITSGVFVDFRWPYHAMVMKMFEQVSNAIVATTG